MAMRIIWTEQANRAIEFIFTCSQNLYGHTLLRKLRKDIQKYEGLLSTNPMMGALETEIPDIDIEFRHIVMTRPFKMIYFIMDDTIYIADIWDTRQNPEHLTERINH